MQTFNADGAVESKPLHAPLFAFQFEGATFHCPCVEPDGKTACLPTRYGFVEWHTGGGCMAYGLELGDGQYLLVTAFDDEMPVIGNAAEEVTIGLYDAEGMPLAYATLNEWGADACTGWDGSKDAPWLEEDEADDEADDDE